MNIKEAAQYLRLNYTTVYKLAQKRHVPAIKVGGNWRFKKDILDEWLSGKATMIKDSVLVVDDDLVIQDLLKEIIEKQGYSVIVAEDGESALREIESHHFDLVFLDLKLSGSSGIDILEGIKEIDRDIVIVIVTGYADDPIALKAMSLGPLLLVRKPFTARDISEVLNIVMKGKLI
jgi:excisionase family DNA binding protein